MSLIKKQFLYVVKDLWRSLPMRVFVAYSVMWTLLESTTFLIEWTPRKTEVLLSILGISLLYGFWNCLPKGKVSFNISNTDTKVKIYFGDLFEAKGLKIIPANEFFDFQLGDHVSDQSLHGKFIQQYYSDDPARFNTAIEEGFETSVVEDAPETVERESGNPKRYKIGTTIPIETNDGRYLLSALTRTDTRTLKSSADVEDLWKALCGMWQQARISANGHTVAIPLVGSGLSGVGLPPQQLLQMIIISIIKETHKEKITSNIEIVIYDSWFGDIDLRAIKGGKF